LPLAPSLFFSFLRATAQGDLPDWRVLAWVAAAGSALLFVARSFMPESPVHLFKTGRSDQARDVRGWKIGVALMF
jgi:hypothetical protein